MSHDSREAIDQIIELLERYGVPLPRAALERVPSSKLLRIAYKRALDWPAADRHRLDELREQVLRYGPNALAILAPTGIGDGLLEPQRVTRGGEFHEGWVFLRPGHWFLRNSQAGDLLIQLPGRSPVTRYVEFHPWSVMEYDPHREHWLESFGLPTAVADDLLRLDAVERTPRYRDALLHVRSSFFGFVFYYVEVDIADLRQGDLLALRNPGLSPRACEAAASITPVGQETLDGLRSKVRTTGEIPLSDITPLPSGDWNAPTKQFRDGRYIRRMLQPGVLVRIRPWNETVSEPIRADSDEAALFELIASVGGINTRSDT